MILVTLGTQDKQFVRLLDIVQEQIDLGNIKDKVIVQAGCTKYESKDMEIFSLIDRDKFGDMIKQCDILITHGGVGSIITGLNNNKKVIGNIHSGWKGTYNKIIVNAINIMIDRFNSNVKDIKCVICPSICKECFEVDEDLNNNFVNNR